MNIRIVSNNTELDLMSNESIKIVDSIQDARDLTKITSAYSQQFNLPATAKNNIFFSRWFNFSIADGFDARFKIDAVLSISGFTFKKGKLRLNGVSIKDGEPSMYKVVFFGDEIEIKDLIGEQLLSSLDLSTYDHEYSDTVVCEGLKTGLGAGGSSLATEPPIIYPLISHTRRFIYDDSDNFHAENETGIASKVKKEDLKPAIRVKTLLEAIETKFNLTFSSVFFNSTYIRNLYLWLNRNKGEIKYSNNDQINATLFTNYDDLIFSSGTDFTSLTVDNETYYEIDYTITTGSSEPYEIRIINLDNGEVLAEANVGEGGNETITAELPPLNIAFLTASYNIGFEIDASNALSTFTQTVTVTRYARTWTIWLPDATGDYTFPNNNVGVTINLSRLMPNIKIFDFLELLFKTFNLTAYKNDDGEIVVEPLPHFYDNPKLYDITQYVDASQSDVNRLFPYSSVIFDFKGRDTFLLKNRDDQTGLKFGALNFNGDRDFDGKPFKIEVGGEKMLYERVSNVDQGTFTRVGYGWGVNSDEDAFVTNPLLFYREPEGTSPSILEFNANSSEITLTEYNRPSNTFAGQTLNFGAEIDEYDLITNENGLFKNYYRDFVASLYDPRARLVKCTAYLPLNIILSYSLKDVFVIDRKRYRINKISTNLITGKSELELFVDIQTITESINGGNPNRFSDPDEVGISLGTITTTSIQVNYDGALSGVTRVNTFIDQVADAVGTTYGTSYTFTGLKAETTYRLGIQFQIGSTNNTQIYYVYATTGSPTALTGTWDDDIADFSNDIDTFDID